MRNLSQKNSNSSVSSGVAGNHYVDHRREGSWVNVAANSKAAENTPTAYSQRSRQNVMFENTQQAILFINQQSKVVQNLIQQFQLYIGYREQLTEDCSLDVQKHAWGVYLMYAQSIHNSLKQTFNGKALFGDGISPPIRMHLEQNGETVPYDLPDPCLNALISIRSFLAGILDHQLPSVELANSCLVDLFNVMTEIQAGRERLLVINRKLSTRKNLPSPGISIPIIKRERLQQDSVLLGTIKERLRTLFFN